MNEKQKKECPFRKDLECENCRFFMQTERGKQCLFESLLWHIAGIDLFGKK